MSDSGSTRDSSSSGKPKKQLLTHESARLGPQKPREKAERVTPLSPPPVSGKPAATERVKAGIPEVNPAALSEKMAAISSLRESNSPSGSKIGGNWHERAKMMSSLPEALSRVDRRIRLQNLPEHMQEAERAMEEALSSEELLAEDPDPGTLRVLTWFLFRFGRFVRGPMLRQTPFMLIGLLIILSMSFSAQGMEWTMPSLTSVSSVFVTGSFFLRLLVMVAAAAGFYLLLSLLLVHLLKVGEDRARLMFGIRVVVNAFLPLAVVQSFYVLLHNAVLGEAFWRGAPLGITAVWTTWIFPLCWAWCSFRIAQAVCTCLEIDLLPRIFVKTGAIALGCVMAAPLHPAVVGWTHQGAQHDWNELRRQVQEPGSSLNTEAFSRLEKGLPLHATESRRELYLYRLQQHFRQGDTDAALDDALRLDRISPEHTAMDHVAKGLTLFLRGRLDLAVQRWKTAVELDPDCLHAHQWLALASVGANVEEAEHHARILMRQDPNVFHLYLLVRILDSQEKHAAIWEAMFDVDAPPEEWYPLTLLQGGMAARELGKVRRAERLLTLAEARGLVPEPAPDAATVDDPDSEPGPLQDSEKE